MSERFDLSILYYQDGWHVDLSFVHWYNLLYFLALFALKMFVLEWLIRKISNMKKRTFMSQGAKALRGMPILSGIIVAVYAILAYLLGSNSPIVMKLLDPLITAVILLMYLVVIARYVRSVIMHALKSEDHPRGTSILVNIPIMVIYILGIILILSNFGISLTPLVTAVGFSGFMAVFAMQNSLGNLFAGIFILLVKKFRIGDYILLGTGEMGYVVDINWMNTSLKAGTDNIVIIPNSKISDSIITNYSWPTKELRVTLEFSVPYNCDLNKVEEYIKEIIVHFEKSDHIKESTVNFTVCGEFGIVVAISVSVDDFDAKDTLRHKMIKQVQTKLLENGIEMGGAKRIKTKE